MNSALKNIVIMLLIMFSSFIQLQARPALRQRDIDQFLEFSDDYITLAKRFVTEDHGTSISDYFYSDSKKLFSASSNFLKKRKWTYEKMNDFLFIVGLSMEAIAFYDEYGYPEEVGESDDDPFKDIPKEVLDLVKRNKKVLTPYFPPMSLDDFSELDEYDDYDDYDDYEPDDDYEEEKEVVVEEIIEEDNSPEIKEVEEPDREKIPLNRRVIGRYTMEIEGDTYRGFSDSIEIRSIDGSTVKGVVVIDWGIGPEAREPMDWEIMYTKSFLAKRSGNTFNFTVIVGAGTTGYVNKYSFSLYPVKDNKGNIALEGRLKITEIDESDRITHCKVRATQ